MPVGAGPRTVASHIPHSAAAYSLDSMRLTSYDRIWEVALPRRLNGGSAARRLLVDNAVHTWSHSALPDLFTLPSRHNFR